MKNHDSRVLTWFAALALAGLAVACANSEPINGFDPYPGSGTGGITATGTGGSSSTGGSPGTGCAATGGSPGTGGSSSTGGSPGTGGSVSGTGGQAAGGHAGSSAGGHAGGGGATGNGGRGAGGATSGGGGAGGSSNATFAFVSTTIMSNCGGTTCHNGSQSVKFDSTSTTTLYTNLTTMTAPDCKGLPLVTPGDPTKSALYLAISKMCGGTLPQMPDGKPALPTATISSIQTWIANGAPQQ